MYKSEMERKSDFEMEYKDMTLYWIYGEQEGAANGTDDE